MVFAYLEKNGTASTEKKLDQNRFSEDELLSIKTKLNLPYFTGSATFERTYGTVSVHGVVYTYVKQRVYNDTLELLCLPDAVKTKLQAAQNEFSKSTADGQASLPHKKTSELKISLPDFCQSLTAETNLTVDVKRNYPLQYIPGSLSTYHSRQERPPQEVTLA